MESTTLQRDCIHRYLIRGAGDSTLRRERAVKSTASVASLHSSRLSRAAIVCVRSLHLSARAAEPDGWGAVSAELEVVINHATRPGYGHVSTDAPAVIFADEAEFLVCLARAWLNGDLNRCWWWRSLLGAGDLQTSARAQWLERCRAVPAAIAHFDDLSEPVSFLQTFAVSDLDALCAAVGGEFDLHRLIAVWPPASETMPSRILSAASANLTPPWEPWLRLPADVQESVARLLVFSITVQRAPCVARSIRFAGEIVAWRQAVGTSLETRSAKPSSRPVTALVSAQSNFSSTVAAHKTSAVADQCSVHSIISRRPAFIKRVGEIRIAPGTAENEQPRLAPSALRVPDSTVLTSARAPTLDRPASCPDQQSQRPIAPELADEITTPWGGIFYLVNVALALEWYGDFTSPSRPGLALPLWDFLALFAERFVGHAYLVDPLNKLLARLSARAEDEPPGHCFESPDGQGLDAWLDERQQRMRDRLEAALGPQEGDELRDLVFARLARICTTRTRLDVTFSLAEHPIALRLAGLDRDPGWVPAAGRSIAFHYE